MRGFNVLLTGDDLSPVHSPAARSIIIYYIKGIGKVNVFRKVFVYLQPN